MKKNMKKLGLVMTLAMSLTMFTGCGKKDGVDVDAMIDKYAGMCELGEYKGIEYEHTETVVTEDMVQAQVDSLVSSYATSTQVTEGTVQNGDTVNIDFVGSVDGVEFEGGSSEGEGYNLTLGSGTMIDGFEEQIVGHDVGETFDIDVTFPDEYGSTELAGQDAVFEITINYITETEYPEYTDEFIASNTSFSTISDYEENIRTSLKESYAASDENFNKAAVMTAVIDATTINEYPQQEMEELVSKTMSDITSEAESSGYGEDLATYITAYYGFSSVEAFESYLQGIVEDYAKEKIVVCAIAKAENITVTEEEIKEYKQMMMDSYGITDEDEFAKHYSDEDVAYYALAENVVEFLLENGTPASPTDAE